MKKIRKKKSNLNHVGFRAGVNPSVVHTATKRKVAIIGPGRVGLTIGLALKRKGYTIVGVAGRTLKSARRGANLLKKRADTRVRPYIESTVYSTKIVEVIREAHIILITTPDREIEKVVKLIAESSTLQKGTLVIHTSGAMGVDVLDPLQKNGALTLAMHPIMTFSAEPVKWLKGNLLNKTNYQLPITNIQGCYWGLDGKGKALQLGKKLVKDLGGNPVQVSKEGRILYHTAASISSNFLVTLIDFALRAYEEIGIPRKKGIDMMLPLVQGTLNNIEKSGIPQALTGPIERGDVEVVREQVKVIRKELPEFLPLFLELGRKTLGLAKEKGTLTSKAAREMKRILKK
jgi:predicted short-subunit dehydrogenase-like oxidoreductase (DUF2520 family)